MRSSTDIAAWLLRETLALCLLALLGCKKSPVPTPPPPALIDAAVAVEPPGPFDLIARSADGAGRGTFAGARFCVDGRLAILSKDASKLSARIWDPETGALHEVGADVALSANPVAEDSLQVWPLGGATRASS